MNRMNPKVDAYLRKAKKWQQEFEKLRMIILDCGLTEELKWGVPCYTFEKSQKVAGRNEETEKDQSRLWADRRIEVG